LVLLPEAPQYQSPQYEGDRAQGVDTREDLNCTVNLIRLCDLSEIHSPFQISSMAALPFKRAHLLRSGSFLEQGIIKFAETRTASIKMYNYQLFSFSSINKSSSYQKGKDFKQKIIKMHKSVNESF